MSTDEDDDKLLSALCPYCNANIPIYTCPRCYARTCSVSCCKKHKLYRQCNGERDPAAFVRRSKLMTESAVNRDFNFLTTLERKIANPVSAPVMKDRKDNGVREEDGKEGVTAITKTTANHTSLRVMKLKLQNILEERNIRIKWAPWDGFKRAKENQTRVVHRNNVHGRRKTYINWTVEWLLIDNDAGKRTGRRILDHNVSENSEVAYSFFHPTTTPTTSTTISTEGINRKANKPTRAATEFYLVLEAPANKKLCVKLSRDKPWTDNLRERTVLEFPQVLVTANKSSDAFVGWEIVRDERRIVELSAVERDTKNDLSTPALTRGIPMEIEKRSTGHVPSPEAISKTKVTPRSPGLDSKDRAQAENKTHIENYSHVLSPGTILGTGVSPISDSDNKDRSQAENMMGTGSKILNSHALLVETHFKAEVSEISQSSEPGGQYGSQVTKKRKLLGDEDILNINQSIKKHPTAETFLHS